MRLVHRHSLFALALFAGTLGALLLVPFRVPGFVRAAPPAPEAPPPVVHLPTPHPLKAIYLTSYVAGLPSWRGRLEKLVETTELNAVVIDVKDYTGRISFDVSDPSLKKIGAAENRIPKIREVLQELHDKHIYAIARIAVFQDPYFAKLRPDLAVKRASDGAVWRDRKGIRWLDPGAREVWDYTAAIGREATAAGFDELNFDYVRFPSDGDMTDISYPFYREKKITKAQQIGQFFRYLADTLHPTGATISCDLFGMTTSNKDDLGIGQVLEDALPSCDYVAPMVYPSHYPPTFEGYANPAAHPYEVVKFALDRGVQKALAASSSPLKLRPWLQDFDLGAVYTASMVRAQIKATNDAGLDSWMLWDPKNLYTPAALLPK